MSRLRIGIARIMHESNSFSAVDTDIGHFRAVGGVLIGPEVLERKGHRDEITGFLDVIQGVHDRVEVVPLLSADGFAAGNVTMAAVQELEDLLRRMLQQAGRLDGILFALHGAMSSAVIPDLDGHLLQLVRREVGESIPVVCTLDLHAVVTQSMVDLATALVAYWTHPHMDVVETGRRGAGILLRVLAGEIKPVMAWQKIPMIVPPPDDGTKSGALKELFDAVRAQSRRLGVVDASLCCSQCWLDVPQQGWTALAIADGDEQLARQLVRDMATQAWCARERLLPEKMLSPQEAVRAAAAAEGHPIIITDSADTAGAGAPGDTTALLQALLEGRHLVNGLILVHLPDAGAVQAITGGDVGSTVTLDVGGKRDIRFSKPVRVRGQVLCVTDGVIEDVGKFGATPFVDAGKTVCLGVDNLRLVLTEKLVFGPQPSLFRKVEIDPFSAKIVALKTGIGFKVTYGHVAKAVVRADCPGAASYNLNNYDYTHVGRPFYPLDPNMVWRAAP